jgi:hypothetical protein
MIGKVPAQGKSFRGVVSYLLLGKKNEPRPEWVAWTATRNLLVRFKLARCQRDVRFENHEVENREHGREGGPAENEPISQISEVTLRKRGARV